MVYALCICKGRGVMMYFEIEDKEVQDMQNYGEYWKIQSFIPETIRL